jgi:hypothetical protein
MISEPMVHLAQTVDLSCTDTNTISKWTETGLHLSLVTVPSGASKMIYEPMVHLAQTVHLSCADTNTLSEWTEMRFHMTHVTEFYRVCLK